MYGVPPIPMSCLGTYLQTCDQELREFHAAWLRHKEEEQRKDAVVQEPERESGKYKITAEAPAPVEPPVAFISQHIPSTTIDFNIASSISRSIVSPPTLRDVGFSSEPCVSVTATAISSPTFSFSTVSDLTPTEFGEIERSDDQTITRHDTFHFEDGNVEIVCGDTLFRVHSTIISFSSSKLRNILSPPSLFNAPMSEGRPRITVSDSAEDFSALLKMIYTPGWVSPPLELNSTG